VSIEAASCKAVTGLCLTPPAQISIKFGRIGLQ
jgi:hypothetical protein